MLPGLYKITSKHFIFEYCESNSIACAKFHTSTQTFQCSFVEEPLTIYGISYCGFIEVSHSNFEPIKILIPAFRSYDPAGIQGSQYVASKQLMVLLKLLSVEIRASLSGVKERRIEKIKRNIENISHVPNNIQMLWN